MNKANNAKTTTTSSISETETEYYNKYSTHIRCKHCDLWIPKDKIEQYTKPPLPTSTRQRKLHCKKCGMMIREKSHNPRIERGVKRI